MLDQMNELHEPATPSVLAMTPTVWVDHPPPTYSTTTTTTLTTLPPTTTTTTSPESTYQAVSLSESTDVWDKLADCESGGNWGSRGTYEGGLQFSPSTWSDYVAADKPYGLVDYPPHAYDATREQQITVAIRVRDGVGGSSGPYLNAQGWNAWPTCRYAAGV